MTKIEQNWRYFKQIDNLLFNNHLIKILKYRIYKEESKLEYYLNTLSKKKKRKTHFL